nr:Rne/Rng family ribonuclease [Dermatophilaceae bacterium]
MVDKNDTPTELDPAQPAGVAKRTRRRAASRPAGPPAAVAETAVEAAPESAAPAKKTTRRASTKKAAAAQVPAPEAAPEPAAPAESAPTGTKKAAKATKKTTKRTSKKTAAAAETGAGESDEAGDGAARMVAPAFVAPLFQAPEPVAVPEPADDDAPVAKKAPARRSRRKATEPAVSEEQAADESTADESTDAAEGDDAASSDQGDDPGKRRRRRRGGRGRKRRGADDDDEAGEAQGDDAQGGRTESAGESDEDDAETLASKRRRRRRRRGADGELEAAPDDPPNTVVRVREPRAKGNARGGDRDDDVTSVRGSTRLEAKKQRRREGREAGRRRAPILTEAEFLTRRESVDRVMVVRQKGDRTQIAVLEDGVLVEHYVTRGSSSSMVGNVYLGRVQNVLPSMEAAFVDIGRGRNAVLYAGEVNWDAAGLEGQPKRIEFALKSGDPVLVQVTKDPVGQKGARLTSQISLPGRFLVYVPDGSMTGISRKLPDTERSRLKSVLKRVMPEDAGVIVRTAAEGAPEEALEQDVERLTAQWTDITAATKSANPPTLLYSEPDLAIKVVRDIFNEDVHKLVISGDGAWTAISSYIGAVAPDLVDRLQNWVAGDDVFAEYRVEEQLMKALDRKVYLPSGGSLVIDRTEAMTVVDVNTGKFTGQGGNLEQTVTRNNLEAAEEIVRQLRLRDIGGIIVVDFIDMVLESNRDLVLRRLVECLGRDRTKHQVAEVTSLGLVQMTRKRIGSGLLESFSESCEHCNGRGIRVSLHGDHDHSEASPKYRRPANAVDPADVAARALAAHEIPDAAESDSDEDHSEIELTADEAAALVGESAALVDETDIEAVVEA